MNIIERDPETGKLKNEMVKVGKNPTDLLKAEIEEIKSQNAEIILSLVMNDLI